MKYHAVGTIPKSNGKIVERGQIYTPLLNTQIHDCLLSWLGTGTLIESGDIYDRRKKSLSYLSLLLY